VAKNLRVVHQGMGWPPGAVLPPHALANDGADHIAIGAVVRTEDAVTHEVTAFAQPATEAEAEAEVGKLQRRIKELEPALAGAVADLRATRAANEKLVAENAELWKQLEAATAVVERREGVETQARLNPGAPVG